MKKEEYIKTMNINGNSIDLGIDDYGQQYFIEWEDSEGKHEMGLGSYNMNYMSDILYKFDPNFKRTVKVLLNGESLDEESKDKLWSYINSILDEYEFATDLKKD